MTKPSDWAQELDVEFPCRKAQLRALLTLYSTSPDFPLFPTTLVVHGPECSGKSSIVKRVLEVVERGAVVDDIPCVLNGISEQPRVETAIMVPPMIAPPNPRKRKHMSDEDGEDNIYNNHRETVSLNGGMTGANGDSSNGADTHIFPNTNGVTPAPLYPRNGVGIEETTPKDRSIAYPFSSSRLPARKRVHAIINCRECITGRQLFEETLRKARQAVSKYVPSRKPRAGASAKCDSLAVLLVKLETLLNPYPLPSLSSAPGRGDGGMNGRSEDHDDDDDEGDVFMDAVDEDVMDASRTVYEADIPELVLVLDGIDRQREPPATLLAALTRFGERIRKLSVLLIVRTPAPMALHSAEVQHLFFPAYARNEVIEIVSLMPEGIFSVEELQEMEAEEQLRLLAVYRRQEEQQIRMQQSNGFELEEPQQPDHADLIAPVKRGRGRPKKNATTNGTGLIKAVSSTPSSNDILSTSSSTYTLAEAAEDAAWLWPRFCAVVWDSVGKAANRDLSSFRRTCRRIWPRFVQPIRDEEFGTRDFAKLLITNRAMFSGEGDTLGRLRWDTRETTNRSENETDLARYKEQEKEAREGGRKWEESSNNLAYFAKFLLCAAYLASYNPARTDTTFFVRGTEGAKKRRRKRVAASASGRSAAAASAGGLSASGSSMTATTNGAGAGGSTTNSAASAKRGPGRPPKNAGVGMHASLRAGNASAADGPASVASVASVKAIPRTLLNPSPFPLDRLLSITMALLDLHLPAGVLPVTSSDLLPQIATLSNLRLFIRAGGSSASTTTSGASIMTAGRGGGGSGGGGGTAGASATAGAGAGGSGASVGGAYGNTDLLDPSSKWRVNYGWEFVGALARSVGIEMREYLADDL